MHEAASAIAADVSGQASNVVVVYSNREGSWEDGTGRWVSVSQEDYFGRKFGRLLQEVPSGHALLLIQADAECTDWAGLFRRFEHLISHRSDIGLWTPVIDNTPFPFDQMATSPDQDGLWEVAQTDGIVLGIAPRCVDRLKRLDFTSNNFGWGVDWAAIGFCQANGLKVIGDSTRRIHHPEGSGYNHDDALGQMTCFLQQLSEAEAQNVTAAQEFVIERTHQLQLLRLQKEHESGDTAPMTIENHKADLAILDHVSLLVVKLGSIEVTARDPKIPITVRSSEDKGSQARVSPLIPQRALDFDISLNHTVQKVFATGERWSYRGQSTLKTIFFGGFGRRQIALTKPIELEPDHGSVYLHFGVAAHRANVEVLIEIDEGTGSEDLVTFNVPIEERFTGLAEISDYQIIDVRIPDNGRRRKVSVSLCYLGGREAEEAPPLVLASRPFLLSPEENLSPTSAIVLIADDHASDTLTNTVIPILPSEEALILFVGDRPYQLIPAPHDEVNLVTSGRTMLASANSPTDVTLFVNDLSVRRLKVGSEPISLDLDFNVIEASGTVIELRDVTGNMVQARFKALNLIPATNTDPRHPDAWAVEALFDTDFYLSGFPPQTNLPDPASHYLTEGWQVGRDPAPWFSTWHYLAMHSDVAGAGMNPFLHYCVAGHREGRTLPRLGRSADGDVYAAHAFAVAPGPDFEEFDPTIGVGRRKRAKVLAYYLPQFHPIDVNDKQWGKGFTEWRNLPRGMPRFMGHIQPRIPRDLGSYSLAEGDAMRRQIEMAKAAGLFGFCFYHYWFDGQRVLETPMERLLADPTLDFPFCLMWANENWTRTWDGSEQEVILGQNYRAEDDIPFIDDLARHMKDRRYIHVDGRPLLFIYRPGQIPDAKETIARFRELFHDRHGLKPLIMMAQGFNDIDPRAYDLDGAIEFPPHKVAQDLPRLNGELELLDHDYRGDIFGYDDMVEKSCDEKKVAFPLIRTVTPTWDNEARRPGRGMILHGSTPEKFGSWVDRMLDFARSNPTYGEQFICVNAWNEWAEGAVLEPDVHHGAAYLNALSRAIYNVSKQGAAVLGKVVIVGHDAHINGAQMLALNIGQTLKSRFGFSVQYVLGDDGPLIDRYRAIGQVQLVRPGSDDAKSVFSALVKDGHTLAITNTTATGRLVPALKDAGFTVVSLIHELPNLLKNYNLHADAKAIAKHSDKVIFPAQIVRDGFESTAGPISHAAEVLPQGLYNTAVLEVERGDGGLRAEFGLADETRIVLGVGYADLRKGIDRFVSVGLSLAAAHPNIAFLWVGALANEALDWFQPEIDASGLGDRVRILGHRDDVARFFAAADAYYLSSREDPFPSVVLEALACGLPVIGHRGCGGCDDLIDRHGTLVAQNDPMAAAFALLKCVDKPNASDISARRDEITTNYNFTNYAFGLMQRLNPNLASVSAVVPNYNYADYIGGRLRTVFDQTYPLREVVVLDDASSDSSVAVIRKTAEAAGRSIALHVNAKNCGSPFPQWRKGVDLACGEYVWIAEADDLAMPDFVERLIDRMRRAGSVLGFTDSAQIDENGAPLGPSYRPYINEIEPGAFDLAFDMDGPDFLARYLAVKNVILNVSGVIFRRDALLDAFASVGEELYDYHVAGDWRLYAELCSRKGSRVSYLPDPLNTHRRHQVSVTHALNVDKHLAEIGAMHKTVSVKTRLSNLTKALQRKHLKDCRQALLRGL